MRRQRELSFPWVKRIISRFGTMEETSMAHNIAGHSFSDVVLRTRKDLTAVLFLQAQSVRLSTVVPNACTDLYPYLTAFPNYTYTKLVNFIDGQARKKHDLPMV